MFDWMLLYLIAGVFVLSVTTSVAGLLGGMPPRKAWPAAVLVVLCWPAVIVLSFL
jgi:hypothetical protein